MSGGSFNFLYQAHFAHDLSPRVEDIKRMRDVLYSIGQSDAVQLTNLVLEHLERANTFARDLEPVWQAIEWWQSSDESLEGAIALIAEWRKARVNKQKTANSGLDPDDHNDLGWA